MPNTVQLRALTSWLTFRFAKDEIQTIGQGLEILAQILIELVDLPEAKIVFEKWGLSVDVKKNEPEIYEENPGLVTMDNYAAKQAD
jgi:hypothetical protein